MVAITNKAHTAPCLLSSIFGLLISLVLIFRQNENKWFTLVRQVYEFDNIKELISTSQLQAFEMMVS
jgi:hypothetical protein